MTDPTVNLVTSVPHSKHEDLSHLKPMANAIRALSMDAVEKAQSGHPGMPMGMADIATVLFSQYLKFDAANPNWPDRDRFVLSNGHGSMLLYSLGYLTGYAGMTLDQIKNFRQWGSHTAGHPEHDVSLGIETTTGPLGQGLGNAVGMALAERIMNARFGDDLVDHRTYVFVGDGCLSEGISQEAISFAGHLQLSKLIVLFDDNQITIDGPTSLSISDDQCKRLEASGWHCQKVDGHDPAAIATAIEAAHASDKPSFIACRTVIGFGSPHKAGKASSHGSPLGAEEILETKQQLGWTSPPFEIPDNILAFWREIGHKKAAAQTEWQTRFMGTDKATQAEFNRRLNGILPQEFNCVLNDLIKEWTTTPVTKATRQLSQTVLDRIAPIMPELIGGSADLTGSNNTKADQMTGIAPGHYNGDYIYYGVREHGMGAIMNGLALHGGIIPYGGTFMTFSDYCRPAIRLSALMKQRVIYVMTHDSIGLGEDGPTHQPIEHLAALRAIPNLLVFRPADPIETLECWQAALEAQDAPSIITLTRQNVRPMRLENNEQNRCRMGAYVLKEASTTRQVTLLSTGSEVSLAMDVATRLEDMGIPATVVSMPCWELFEQQTSAYKESVMGPETTLRVSIEAASTFGWERYVGMHGIMVGMTTFGASAPAPELFKHFGFTVDNIIHKITMKLGE
jgi:transketolase